MQLNIIKSELPKPNTNKKCWQEIASDPIKLRYWKEIAQLWKKTLGVDVKKLSHIEESSFNNHYHST